MKKSWLSEEKIIEKLQLPADHKKKIYTDNARKLFGL